MNKLNKSQRGFWLLMKIIIVHIFIASFSMAFANPYDSLGQEILEKKVTINVKDVTIQQVLTSLEEQAGVSFTYSPTLFQTSKTATLHMEQSKLSAVLQSLLNPHISFKVIGNKILLQPGTSKEGVRPITGKISDENGAALPGASIYIKGTTNGTVSGATGEFALEVNDGDVLQISSIGYKNMEVVVGSQTTISIQLEVDVTNLNEVIVTALGVKKETRSLGYATATVNSTQLTENRTTSTFGVLQGQLSGVNITMPSTGPQGSTKIRIRGQSSFSGANNPLIVVDGMPLDNSQFDSGPSNRSDQGDGLSSINPDNIETMTVLKGAAASALYGSRAKDGVIMITTKRSASKGLGVEYNVNFSTQTPLDFTDFQYEYGQGERGIRPTTPWPTSGVWSFGEKFQPGMTQVLFDNVTVPYEPVRNRIKKFYDVGQNLTNTVRLSSSTDKNNFSISLSDNSIQSIIPGSTFKKKTINIGYAQSISKNLSVEGMVNYSNERNHNPPMVGGQDFSAPYALSTASNSMPLDLLKEYAYDAQGNELVWSRFYPRTNPYFSIAKRFEDIVRDRLFGNILVKYKITDWLFVQGRIAQDFYARSQEYNIPTGYLGNLNAAPPGYVDGYYQQTNNKFRETNYDFLIGANKTFGKFGLNVTAGGNQMYRRSEVSSMGVRNFIQRGLYTIGNGGLKFPGYSLSERAVNSLYGSAEVSFNNYLFLNVTGRNDWFSTLAENNRSLFYPSATTSFVFSDAFENMPSWLSFGKVRVAYAHVGDDNVAPYSDQLYYSVNDQPTPNPQGALIPVGTIQGSQIPNRNLQPLTVSEFETGLNLKLFADKIGFDVSYYHKTTRNQIVSAQVSDASSYNSQLINVGESLNQGIEIDLRLTPVKTNAFTWNLNTNFTYNTSEVIRLGLTAADTMITIGSVRQVVGRQLGQIYANLQMRDEDGNKVFNKSSGFPVRNPIPQNVGQNQPNYWGGISNVFNYKGVSFSSLITFKLGKRYVMTGGNNSNYWRHGLHKGTLPGRDVGYVIGEGVNETGEVNTTHADIQPFYEAVNSNIADQYINKAGFWKLSQLNLSYDFSPLLPKSLFVKGLKLSIIANNVATLKKWTLNMDPEELVGSFSDNDSGGGSTSVPLQRSVGFNLNVKI